jgi:hypothetical protein
MKRSKQVWSIIFSIICIYFSVESISKRYNVVMKISVIVASLSLIGMNVMFLYWGHIGKYLMFILSILLGFFANLCLQIAIQMGIEVCFPISEETVANFIIFGAHTLTVIFILLMSIVNMRISTWIILGWTVFPSMILIFTFRGQFLRTMKELEPNLLTSVNNKSAAA